MRIKLSPALTAIAAIASLGLSGCTSVADLPTERLASARLTLANGIPAGTVQIVASGNDVTLIVAATGISAGEHGFHLHTKGQCSAPDFKSAGGHLNPLDRTHGFESAGGSHVGDLPNLVANSSGTASARIPLAGNRAALMDWLFDADGTAVVIHAGPDDYISDPAGAAGPRVACGVLIRA